MLRLRGPGLIALATLLWGTTGTAQALGPAGIDPLTVGSARLLVGAIALLLVARAGGHLRGRAPWPDRPMLIAGLAIAAYQPLFFAAVDRTGVALGTIVAIGSAPVFSGLIAWRLDRRFPSSRWAAGTAAAIVGVVVLVTAGREVGGDVSGVLLATGAGAMYAIYVMAARQLTRAGDVIGSTAIIFAIAALALIPLLVIGDTTWIGTARGSLVVLHLGLVTTAGAYLLFAHGLEVTRATAATTLSLGEPLTAAVLGVTVIGERPPMIMWIGAALVMAALGAVAIDPDQSGAENPATVTT